jgi:hypothetical protein
MNVEITAIPRMLILATTTDNHYVCVGEVGYWRDEAPCIEDKEDLSQWTENAEITTILFMLPADFPVIDVNINNLPSGCHCPYTIGWDNHGNPIESF